ncbi:GCY protein [Xylariales sp. PMI_506]|nr:GCY protein [Xylariales sp. PMI_506]
MPGERTTCLKSFKLNNGYELPAVGLGTWQGKFGTEDAEVLEGSIVHALQSGYRLIDTAQYYEVERNVGSAIRASGVPRSEVVVMTKFWGHWHHDPAEALRISLRDLGLDYVDVFLMHWPWATKPDGGALSIHESPTFVETWAKMEKLVGPKCRSIGVSNFTQKTLDVLLQTATIVPAVNQVELHAFNPNLKLVPYCQSKGIHVVSWSTMNGDRGDNNLILSHELFTNIAKAHDCSTGVVSLSWAVQRGVTVIPKSSSKTRIADNIKLVTLTDEEMEKINSAHQTIKRNRVSDGITRLQITKNGKTTMMGWSNVDFGWEDEDGNWLV